MRDEISRRIEQLEAHAAALTDIVLSAILASDDLAPGLPASTVYIAETQRDHALKEGATLHAIRLDMLLDKIRRSCDLPAND